MKNEKILYLKGNPEHILPVILIIRKHNFELENKTVIQEEIANTLLEEKSKARIDNLIYARIKPTLVALKLLHDEKDRFSLTHFSSVLTEGIRDSDYDFKNKIMRNSNMHRDFKNKMGRILIDLDYDKSKVIQSLEEIQKSPSEFVGIVDLMVHLKEKGINPSQKIKESDINDVERSILAKNDFFNPEFNEGSRLKELLRYYDYFELLIYRKNQVSLNKVKINSLKKFKPFKDVTKISNDDFFKSFDEAYSFYRKKVHSNYVPVRPNIERYVCYQLGISPESFISKLAIFPTIFKNKKIILAASREPKPENETIKRGKSVYYYVSIFEGGEN